MGLADQAILDFQQFSGDANGFGVPIILLAPDSSTITVNGFSTDIHLGINAEGQEVNTKKSTITVSEGNLTGYPVRDANGEVNLKNHRATVILSNGVSVKYKVMQWFQDQKIGAIVMVFEEVEP